MNPGLVAPDGDETRHVEAAWMTERMKYLGMSNSKLHDELGNEGFRGRVNNITMWKTARTSIPNEWLVNVIQLLVPDDPEPIIVEMYSRRFPYLRPYFKDIHEAGLGISLDPPPASDVVPKNFYYIPKSGKLQGTKFVPHRNRKGLFQGGISRFSKDIREFETIEELWRRITVDPEFKVRMAPEDKSAPPSLIKKDSLIVDW